jgi:hypothetical protein
VGGWPQDEAVELSSGNSMFISSDAAVYADQHGYARRA